MPELAGVDAAQAKSFFEEHKVHIIEGVAAIGGLYLAYKTYQAKAASGGQLSSGLSGLLGGGSAIPPATATPAASSGVTDQLTLAAGLEAVNAQAGIDALNLAVGQSQASLASQQAGFTQQKSIANTLYNFLYNTTPAAGRATNILANEINLIKATNPQSFNVSYAKTSSGGGSLLQSILGGLSLGFTGKSALNGGGIAGAITGSTGSNSSTPVFAPPLSILPSADALALYPYFGGFVPNPVIMSRP